MAFARSTTRGAARFFVSTITFFLSMPIFRRKADETTFTEYSECDEVALTDDSFVIELRERDIGGNERISVAEALVYEPRPASIRSVSSASVESTDDLDITPVPLSVDELKAMRLRREPEAVAEKRKRKRPFLRRMASCFGQECFV